MIYKASECNMPSLVTKHFVQFDVSPVTAVTYTLHLLEPKILWRNRSWSIALVAPEHFSATSVFIQFFSCLDKQVYSEMDDIKRITIHLPNFQDDKPTSNCSHFRFKLPKWDWNHMKDF